MGESCAWGLERRVGRGGQGDGNTEVTEGRTQRRGRRGDGGRELNWSLRERARAEKRRQAAALQGRQPKSGPPQKAATTEASETQEEASGLKA